MNPQQKFLKRHQQALENLQKQILGATAELDQLHAQLAVLRDKRKLVLNQVQQKATELEKQLEAKLNSRRQHLEDQIDALKERIATLQDDENRLLNIVSIHETSKQDLEHELHGLEERKKLLITESTQLSEEIDKHAAVIASAELQKGSLERDISGLEEVLAEKKRLVQAVDDEISALETRKTNVAVELNNSKDQKIKQLVDLDAQLMKKIARLKDISRKDTEMRESIVIRQKELDKREDNIKRRELIVGTAEEKIRNNADMLKL